MAGPIGDIVGQWLQQKIIQPREDEHQRRLYGEQQARALWDGAYKQAYEAHDWQTMSKMVSSPQGKKYQYDMEEQQPLIDMAHRTSDAIKFASILKQNFDEQGHNNPGAKANFEAGITAGQARGFFGPDDIAAMKNYINPPPTPEQQRVNLEAAKTMAQLQLQPGKLEQQQVNIAKGKAEEGRIAASTREQNALAESHELSNKEMKSMDADHSFQDWKIDNGLPPGYPSKNAMQLYAKEAYDFHKLQGNARLTVNQSDAILKYMDKNKMDGDSWTDYAKGYVSGTAYAHGAPIGDKLGHLDDLLSQLKSAAIPTYISSGLPRSKQMVDAITQHLPDPKMAPAQIRQRLNDLKAFQTNLMSVKSLTDADQVFKTAGIHDALPETTPEEGAGEAAPAAASPDDTSPGDEYGK